MRFSVLLGVMLLGVLSAKGQNTFNFDGQLSGVANWSPEADAWGLLNGRYLPELNYDWKLDTTHNWYFEASANIYGSSTFYNDSTILDGNVSPYRIWTRFSGRNYEVRLGLQKIDFGSATLLRPLQWFNQIDPRDPLQLTNGVNAVLGRYYFLNNANIWIWGLYGNEKTRGFYATKTYHKHPEFGGRFQYPVPKGELALSYHHRTADAHQIFNQNTFEKIPENRIGLDGKWDVEIGLWFEASYINKSKDVGLLTNQTLLNIGTDYTIGIGNGLNIVAEHLITSANNNNWENSTNAHITASTISYPLALYDNLSTVLYYNWPTNDFTFFLNYSHQFTKITAYAMAFYNPRNQEGVQQNELVNNFSGPGIRFMLVYNH